MFQFNSLPSEWLAGCMSSECVDVTKEAFSWHYYSPASVTAQASGKMFPVCGALLPQAGADSSNGGAPRARIHTARGSA